MSSTVTHSGTVVSVDTTEVKVRIEQSSACSACKVSSHCHSSESKTQIMTVPAPAMPLAVGQQVVVSARKSGVWRAVVWAYVIPLVVMVGTLLACIGAGMAEPPSALAALGSVVVYYTLVGLLRKQLFGSITFSVMPAV